MNQPEQIKADKAIAKDIGNQANASKCPTIDVPHDNYHKKNFASCSTCSGKPEERKTTKNHEQRHCKWCKQVGGSFWSYDIGECTYNANLTPFNHKNSGRKKNCIENSRLLLITSKTQVHFFTFSMIYSVNCELQFIGYFP